MNIFIALFIFSLLEMSCNACATKSSTPPAPPNPPDTAILGPQNPPPGSRSVTCSGNVRESENIGSVTKIVCADGMEHNVDCGQKKYGASSQQKVNGNTVITITCRETTQEESYDYNYNYDSGYEYQCNSG